MSIQLIYKFRNYLLVLVCLFAALVSFGQTDENYKEELKAVEGKLREGKFQEGLQLLDEISVKYPDVADIHYAKSLILVQMRNYDGAVESATLAYEKHKNMFYANHLLELYKVKKDLPNGIALLKDLQQEYPAHEGLNRELLILYAENQQLEEAKRLHAKLITSIHSDTLNLVMSEVYMNAQDLSSAKKLLSKMDGKSMIPDVYGYLGYIQAQEGKQKEALAVIERGIKRTSDKGLYLDLADTYKSMGRYEPMFNALKIAFNTSEVQVWDKYKFLVGLMNEKETLSDDKMQILANLLETYHPDVLEAQILKGELLWKRGNVEEARSVFLKVASSNPRYISAWRLAINTDLALNQPDEAIKHGTEGLKHNPNNTELLYFTSMAYAAKLDYNTSKEFLEAALNYSENDTNFLRSLIYSSLGDLYHELKMESMSDVAYEEAISLDSTNVTALNNYAYYLAMRKKDLDKAAAFSKLSNDIEPNSATFKDTYAWVLFQQEKYSEALMWIEEAVKLDEKSAVLLEHYGDVLSKLNREKDAVVQWQKALSLELEKKSNQNLAKIQQKIKEGRYVE
jgi:tetratricopeptide (TPR) repeat protein